MNDHATRRGILIGGLSSAALPLTVSAHGLLTSQAVSGSAPPAMTGISIAMEQLTWLDVKIEAYDENGIGQTATGYLYESCNCTVIATEQSILKDARKVFLTFTHRGAQGSSDQKAIRMEAAGFQAQPIDAYGKFATVAKADWHRLGDAWHLSVA